MNGDDFPVKNPWIPVEGTDTNRQTRTGTNRGVMEPANENEPQEPNRKSIGTEPKIIVIF